MIENKMISNGGCDIHTQRDENGTFTSEVFFPGLLGEINRIRLLKQAGMSLDLSKSPLKEKLKDGEVVTWNS